jgi:hypothetical protein
MTIDPLHDYRAYLFARETTENFILAFAKSPNGDCAAFHRERGIDELRNLAAHLGFELVPIEAKKEAA